MMTVENFIRGGKRIGQVVNATVKVPLTDAEGRVRKATLTVESVDSLEVADVAGAAVATGYKGKISDGEAKGSLRGISGAIAAPAGTATGEFLTECWDSAGIIIDDTVSAPNLVTA